MADSVQTIALFDGAMSHKLTVKPLTFTTAITGAVATGGAALGNHEIPVDGFTTAESTEISNALSNYKPVYLTVGTTDKTAYRLVKVLKTADAITKIVVFPALKTAATVSDVVSVGGEIEIDVGRIGEEGVKISITSEGQEIVDEVGGIYRKILKVKKGTVKFPVLYLTKENFLLTMPNSYFIVKDGAVAFQYGIKKGIVLAGSYALTCVDKDDPTNLEKTVFFEETVMSSDEINWNLSESDKTVSIPLTFEVTGDKLMSIGDKTAAYATT